MLFYCVSYGFEIPSLINRVAIGRAPFTVTFMNDVICFMRDELSVCLSVGSFHNIIMSSPCGRTEMSGMLN